MTSHMKTVKVPELRPTDEEFVHPIKYLSQPEIAKLGEKYGILKVIPPESWKPGFALDWNTFNFHTRIQKLQELSLRNRSRACFVDGFNCFLQSTGMDPLKTSDDLCLGVSDDFPLKKSQLKNHLNGWLELKDGSKIHIHDIFLSKEYRKWFYKINDFDKELLKKLTTYSKRLSSMLGLPNNNTNNHNHKHHHRHNHYNQHHSTKEQIESNNLVIPSEISHTTLHKLMISPASLLSQPDNLKQLQRMKTRISKSKKTKGRKKRKVATNQSQANKPVDPLTPPLDDTPHYKQDCYTKTTDTIDTLKLHTFPLTPEILSPELLDETCVVCHISDSPESTLLCDGCSRAFHMRCLPIPLERVPKHDWFCSECLAGSTGLYSDYGFEEEFERRFSLNEFRRYCKEWEIEFLQLLRTGQLGSELKLRPEEIMNELSEDTMEKIFWNLTNGKLRIPEKFENMKIRYGADIHSSKPGELSGFPSADNPRMGPDDKKYIDSEWNLTRLPFAKGSLLEYVCSSCAEDSASSKEQISGMSLPWLYVGGTLSTFCWHKEDHYTLSANYSHLGAPKKWYGIPAKYCELFEEVVREVAPEYEAKQKDLMHQLVSMISPEEIKKTIPKGKKFELYETIQRPGEFIITFPKVYHSGFNYGFNVNEAVNFTLPLWVPYSVSAVEEYQKVGKECVFETYGLLRKIIMDLTTKEGRDMWLNDTGISNEDIDDVLKWTYNKYILEIRNFLKLANNHDLVDILQNIKKISLREYYDVNKLIKKENKGIEEKEDEAEYGEADDKLCLDCKTRVHFQWILVDLYKDCMQGLGHIYDNSKVKEADGKLTGLGIKHKDIESEWRYIIQRAKSEEINDDDNKNNNKIEVVEQKDSGNKENEIDNGKPKRRTSSRLQKKRQHEEQDVFEIGEKNMEEKERRELINSLLVLKRENPYFGKYVICYGCFLKEMAKLTEVEQKRVISVSTVIEEYSLEELESAVSQAV